MLRPLADLISAKGHKVIALSRRQTSEIAFILKMQISALLYLFFIIIQHNVYIDRCFHFRCTYPRTGSNMVKLRSMHVFANNLTQNKDAQPPYAASEVTSASLACHFKSNYMHLE